MNRSVALASKLLGSSVLAQVAMLAAIWIAAGRMSTAEFGHYGTVTAVVGVLAGFNTLAAETRFPAVADARARQLFRGGLASLALVLLACLLVASLVQLAAPDLLGGGLGELVVLSGLCGTATGLQQLFTGVALRSQRQHLLARGRLVQGLANAALVLGLLLVTDGFWALTLGWLASLVIGDLVLWFGCRDALGTVGQPQPSDIRVLLGEVRRQPLGNVLAGTVASMPLLVLPGLAPTLNGAWALVSRFLLPLVNTWFNTLQPIYYGRAAQLERDRQPAALSSFHDRWAGWLAVLVVPISLGFYLVSVWILPLVGPQWRVDPWVGLAAALYFGSLVVGLPLSQTLVLMGQVDVAFWWTVGRFVACAAPLALVGVLGPRTALVGWALAACLSFAAQVVIQRGLLHARLVPAATEAVAHG